MTQYCTHCKTTLPMAAFSHDKQTATGYNFYCRDCARDIRKNGVDGVSSTRVRRSAMIIKKVPCMKCGKEVRFKVLAGESYSEHRLCTVCKKL